MEGKAAYIHGFPIEVCLEHVSLSDKPEYNALSYVWGDDERRALILVNVSGKPGSERRDDLATDNGRHACV
jgi:hypothetical protein